MNGILYILILKNIHFSFRLTPKINNKSKRTIESAEKN